jgi:hypothetical protein
MKDFLKFTLATVTGIIISSVVLFFISILVVFSMVSSSESETQVRKNSVMMLDLNTDRTKPGESAGFPYERRLQNVWTGRYSFFYQESERK